MNNFSEAGHAKNVANFEDLINRCTGFGANYNPSLNAIKLANMNTLRSSALNTLTGFNNAATVYANAINNREVLFEPLKKLATRIMAALVASGASAAIIKDAQSINRKIHGKRAKPVKEADEAILTSSPMQDVSEAEVHISVSQQGFNSMVEHYEKLVSLLASVSVYNPNEADLKVSGINALLLNLKAANTAVITATTNLANARISRDALLYSNPNGLLHVVREAKAYIKSIYGASSAQFKLVSSIKFTGKKG
jgi:hypothetical protein